MKPSGSKSAIALGMWLGLQMARPFLGAPEREAAKSAIACLARLACLVCLACLACLACMACLACLACLDSMACMACLDCLDCLACLAHPACLAWQACLAWGQKVHLAQTELCQTDLVGTPARLAPAWHARPAWPAWYTYYCGRCLSEILPAEFSRSQS